MDDVFLPFGFWWESPRDLPLFLPALLIEEELLIEEVVLMPCSWEAVSPFGTGYDLVADPAVPDIPCPEMCDVKIAHPHHPAASVPWGCLNSRPLGFYRGVNVVVSGISKGKSPDVDAQRALNTQEFPDAHKVYAEGKSGVHWPAMKRTRGRNWTGEENEAFLEVMQEAARQGPGRQVWDYISANLYKQRGFDRASKSCMHQWDTLLQSFNAIRRHESKTKSGTSNCLSYWDMDEDGRSQNKLPQAFNMGFCEKIERILSTVSVDEKTRTSSGLPTSKSQLDEAVFSESEVEHTDTGSEDEEVSGDSTTTIESQAGDPVHGHVPQSNQTCESDSETNSKYAGKKRSAATVMEDALISMIAPFVNKQIDDTLKPLLSALRTCGEDEDKQREMLLAMVEGKREKLSL